MSKCRLFLFLIALGIASCKQTASVIVPSDSTLQEEVVVKHVADAAAYKIPQKGSVNRTWDILHMDLEVEPNWQNQQLVGLATLKVTPWFYSQRSIVLDAKGFDINSIHQKMGDSLALLAFEYDSLKLTIQFTDDYKKGDTLILKIDYTAKPNSLPDTARGAIQGEKGLYFVNPLNEADGPMQQLWTQGEAEANSCWFPTIESPQEKFTHTIAITHDTAMVSLSNGKFDFAFVHGDGSQTDYYSMTQPHAAYLVMMALGDFALVKDEWRGKQVGYYVEKEFEPHARAIFGKTPEMMTFYSNITGVEYPWPKYDQIVVREFITGAMENTTAVTFGDYIYATPRQMLDGNDEDVIAHELFHHWFGDYATAESWSHIALNESFATYGEYLWFEYKYGRAEADYKGNIDLENYINESNEKQVPVVRYFYEHPDEVFDNHSYEKGGRILHMLRYLVGDTAFFKSVNLYLTRFAFKNAEISDLRKCFEEVSGLDLNWFFYQWFEVPGHPKLSIEHSIDSVQKNYSVRIIQQKDEIINYTYRLPISIDVYTSGEKERKQVFIENDTTVFQFACSQYPDWVNVDGDKVLLCEKEEIKPVEGWYYQAINGPLFMDRKQALEALSKYADSNNLAAEAILSAMGDRYNQIRYDAMSYSKSLPETMVEERFETLVKIAKNDSVAENRSYALSLLTDGFSDRRESLQTLFVGALKDSSYAVLNEAIYGLKEINPEMAFDFVKNLSKQEQADMLIPIADLYATRGNKSDFQFFKDNILTVKGFDKVTFAELMLEMNNRLQDTSICAFTLHAFAEKIIENDIFWIKYLLLEALLEQQESAALSLAATEGAIGASEETAKRIAFNRFTEKTAKAELESIKPLLQHPTLLKLLEREE